LPAVIAWDPISTIPSIDGIISIDAVYRSVGVPHG
jgi:hypothetical protein